MVCLLPQPSLVVVPVCPYLYAIDEVQPSNDASTGSIFRVQQFDLETVAIVEVSFDPPDIVESDEVSGEDLQRATYADFTMAG